MNSPKPPSFIFAFWCRLRSQRRTELDQLIDAITDENRQAEIDFGRACGQETP